MRHNRERFAPSIGGRAPKLDVTPALGMLHESELSENVEQVLAVEGPKLRPSGDRVQLHSRDYCGV